MVKKHARLAVLWHHCARFYFCHTKCVAKRFLTALTVTYGGQAVQVIRGVFQISPSSLICPYLAGRMGGGLHVSMSVYIVCSMSVWI